MAVVLRLARGGQKKRPYYKIVATDKRNPRDGRFIEKVGTYNPMLAKDDANRVTLVEDRIKYWLSVGAKPSDRVHGFLHKAGILAEALDISHRPTKERKRTDKKTRVELRAEAEAEAAANAAAEEEAAKAAAAEAAAAPAEEAPVEEVAAEAPAEEAKEA